MNCILCKNEITTKSHRFVEPVCLECDNKMLASDRLRKQYHESHKCCPKCGSESHSSTLVGYIFNAEHPEAYKDLNSCVCSNCGDRHTCHERLPRTI